MNNLEYRRQQLETLRSRAIDLEDLSSGVSITDLTLNDLRLDLARLTPDERVAVDRRLVGTHSLIFASENFPPSSLSDSHPRADVAHCPDGDLRSVQP